MATARTSGFELADRSWIHVEVKNGDDDLKKTVGTGEAMRATVRPAQVQDVLLLPRIDRVLWSTLLNDLEMSDPEAPLAKSVTVIDWHQIASGLRLTLAEPRESVTWRVFARAFCGAIEQSLLGLPCVPVQGGLEAVSLLQLENIARYQEAFRIQEHDR